MVPAVSREIDNSMGINKHIHPLNLKRKASVIQDIGCHQEYNQQGA